MKTRLFLLVTVSLLLACTLTARAQLTKDVTVAEAGTLASHFTEAELTQVTNLTVSGPLNGADILTLRSMSGNLQVLDLEEAQIVGDNRTNIYYRTGSSVFYTQDGVVGDYMFFGFVTLERIVLPKDVWSIGSWNTDTPWNTDRTEVSGQPNVTSAEESDSRYPGCATFSRCVNLKEVVFPSSLLWIGPKAFRYCQQLASVSVPEGVEGIGAYAFSNCANLVSASLPSTLGKRNKLRWSTLEDEWSMRTGNYFDYIFRDCTALSEVRLAEGLTVLYGHMFNGCSALTTVELPQSLERMYSSFYNCANLESIDLPQGLTYVGAFGGCSSLTSIVIPDGVTSLADFAFSACVNLESISLPRYMHELPAYSFANCRSLTSIDLSVCNNSIIGSGAFKGCTALENIAFSPYLTTINANAFQDCTALKSAELTDRLLTIGEYAFRDCSSLESIRLPMSLSSIGNSAFRGCSSLKSVDLPDIMMTIESDTFQDCEQLETVDLPVGLMTISSNAFQGCSSLKSVNIPGGVQTISSSAFQNCGLEEVTFEEGLTELENNSFAGCYQLKRVTFPASIKTVAGFNDSGVQEVLFAEGAAPESVLEQAFYNCDSLRTITLPNSITTMGTYVFSGCLNLQSVTLPTGITQIPANTFSECPNLRSLDIPEGVTSIGYDAFVRCYKLASVKFPSTLRTIGGSAFYQSGIESLTLPEGVTTIYGSTFSNCDSLRTVVLPSTLTRITTRYNDDDTSSGNAPFSDCDRLSAFDASKAPLEEICEGAFSSLDIRTLNLSASKFTAVPNRLCYGCDSLRTVVLPATVTSIGESAFGRCRKLSSVNLPEETTTVEEGAFQNCDTLRWDGLPENLASVGRYAFSGTTFADLTLPASLASVTQSAFSHCVFNNLTIPSTVTSIGQYAFDGAEVKGVLDITPAASLRMETNTFQCSGGNNDEEGRYYNYHLQNVNWNSTTRFPKDQFCEIDNLYLPAGGSVSTEDGIDYIFYDGVTDLVTVAPNTSDNRAYRITKAMTAREVTYTRYFGQRSGYGEAAGWQTIVLPFQPTEITHTRGYGETAETVTLAPFGSDALAGGDVLPFWLYELASDGTYQPATVIEANKPYLICMPNNDRYPTENNISGDVRFAAVDETSGITLQPTEGSLVTAPGTSFDLVPTYEWIDQNETAYALNEDNYYYGDDGVNYEPGSVFVRNNSDIEPFRAYLVSHASPSNAPAFYRIGGVANGIEFAPRLPDEATTVRVEAGVLYLHCDAERTVRIYDTAGRTVRQVDAPAGETAVYGLPSGIYLLEGHKVLIP